ncbi:MAG: glycosyltransferase [Candidatus Caenarcaniphilales bacterium]|nr:glycosyltransferase [Candidatus Caenarcaniphilales bacterium]
MPKICHIISGLKIGGAEIMLERLVSDQDRYQHCIISLTSLGEIGNRLQKAGLSVIALDLDRKPWNIFRLIKIIKSLKPLLVQTWLYHGDLIGGIAAKSAGVRHLVWGIHNTTLEAGKTKLSTRLIVKFCAWLSQLLPSKIIACAHSTAEIHKSFGYSAEKFEVIPNGINIDLFKPDPSAREKIRHELNLPLDTFLIGMLARFDPQKDHQNFLEAAHLLLERGYEGAFILAGAGVTQANKTLIEMIERYSLKEKVFLLGQRDDTAKLQSSLDLATLSSAYGEAFPLSLAEAMACEVPVVATDLGDIGLLIGDVGRLVPILSSASLAQAWWEIYQLPITERKKLGSKARRRIQDLYELKETQQRYLDLYHELSSRDVSSGNHTHYDKL